MDEYISRTVADLLLQERAEVYAKVNANYALTIIQGDRAVIHTIEKADVRENVCGKWIDYYGKQMHLTPNGRTQGECYCSICGEHLTASDEYTCRGYFCPNCGADMRGSENDAC